MSDPPWRVELFDRTAHDREGFDCGVESLNEWLRRRASQYTKRDLSRVYVLVRAGGRQVHGFYALSTHAVAPDDLPEAEARGLPHHDVPAILLGQLAVDRTIQGQGLGEWLLLDALRRVALLSEQIGVRAVEVQAVNESAQRFYLNFGFLPFRDSSSRLILTMTEIRRLDFGAGAFDGP